MRKKPQEQRQNKKAMIKKQRELRQKMANKHRDKKKITTKNKQPNYRKQREEHQTAKR